MQRLDKLEADAWLLPMGIAMTSTTTLRTSLTPQRSGTSNLSSIREVWSLKKSHAALVGGTKGHDKEPEGVLLHTRVG